MAKYILSLSENSNFLFINPYKVPDISNVMLENVSILLTKMIGRSNSTAHVSITNARTS